MESFPIRPRVGHGEIPSPASLYHHQRPSVHRCSRYFCLLSPTPTPLCYFLLLLCTSCHFFQSLPLSALFVFIPPLPILAHQSELKLRAFCFFSCSVFILVAMLTQLRGSALDSLYFLSNIEGNMAVEGFDCPPTPVIFGNK